MKLIFYFSKQVVQIALKHLEMIIELSFEQGSRNHFQMMMKSLKRKKPAFFVLVWRQL